MARPAGAESGEDKPASVPGFDSIAARCAVTRRFFSLVFLLVVVALALPLAAQVDPELLAGMKARSIGPAGMSGRIAAIEAVASNPDIIYVGAATGGLWKSESGGLTWAPPFDDQPGNSIRAG